MQPFTNSLINKYEYDSSNTGDGTPCSEPFFPQWNNFITKCTRQDLWITQWLHFSVFVAQLLSCTVLGYGVHLKRKKIRHLSSNKLDRGLNAVWRDVSAPSVPSCTRGPVQIYNKCEKLDPCVKLQEVLHGLRCSQLPLELINPHTEDFEHAFSSASVSYFLL